MFSQKTKQSIQQRFTAEIPRLGLHSEEILSCVEQCADDKRLLMEFYYSYMPYDDIGDCGCGLLEKFADFGLSLLQNLSWADRIPETVLFNDLLHYRVDAEKIEDCRESLFNSLKGRVTGMNMTQTALAVNEWCAEHVAVSSGEYAGASPLGVLKAARGGSREAAVLAVSAMRSVGIPARVVYTPAWAHSDGGHSWVEAWCENGWSAMEACVPDQVLDRDWFNARTSRAMLVLTRSYLPAEGEESFAGGRFRFLNLTERYAEARPFVVTVLEGIPVEGVQVRFEVTNRSGMELLAVLTTDENGRAELTLGRGGVHIHAVKGGRFLEEFVDTAETDFVTLDFSCAYRTEPVQAAEFVMKAPPAGTQAGQPETEAQTARRLSEISWIDQARKEYASGFYQGEPAERLAAHSAEPERVTEILKAAKGNFEEIYNFIMQRFEARSLGLKLSLLESLPEQDLCQVRAEELFEDFYASLQYLEQTDGELFGPYIQCPRIGREPLVPYRSLLISNVGAYAKKLAQNPVLIWEYIKLNFKGYENENNLTVGTPAGMLTSHFADERGRRVEFCAACRAFGVPARLNPVFSNAEYYTKGEFRNVEIPPLQKEGNAWLALAGGEDSWRYREDWSVARLERGVYRTLSFNRPEFINGKLELTLKDGNYRLITAERTPAGRIYGKKYCFHLTMGESKTIRIEKSAVAATDLLEQVKLPPFRLYSLQYAGKSVETITKGKTAVLFWLKCGQAETDRLLNDLVLSRSLLNSLKCKMIFVVTDHTVMVDPALVRARKCLPGAAIYCSNFEVSAVPVAQWLFLNQDVLPLTVVVHANQAVYGFAGYRSGIPELLSGIMEHIPPDSGDSKDGADD